MDALNKALADANKKIDETNRLLLDASQAREFTKLKLSDIANEIKTEFKRLFKEPVSTLKTSTWATSEIQSSSEDHLEQVIQDYIEGVKIKIQNLGEDVLNKKESLKAKRAVIEKNEELLSNADAQIAKLTSAKCQEKILSTVAEFEQAKDTNNLLREETKGRNR